jgi:hypothetical protein
MKKRSFAIGCFFCLAFWGFAQPSLTLLQSVPASGLQKATQDAYGNLYISDSKGNINKYDSTGKFMLNFSPQKLGTVTLLEAWNTIRIFVFYRDFQEYLVLERFLGPMPNNSLNQDQVGFARMATLGSDYNLWLMDETDFSLKKYDRQFNKVLFKTSLELLLDLHEYDINFMREYQNNLYVNDRNSGILVFDVFGSYKKKIAFKGIDFFTFHDDELCYLQNDTLFLFHLYLLSTRAIPLPAGKGYKQVFMRNRKLFAVKPDGVDIYVF